MIPAKYRRYVYAVAVAAVPVLVFYGLLDPKAAPLVLPLLLALLNVRDDRPAVATSVVNVNLEGGVNDPVAVGREIERVLRIYRRSTGRDPS